MKPIACTINPRPTDLSRLINDLRAALQTGTPLGNNRFKEEVEKLLGVDVGYARRGRPQKQVVL